MRHRLWFVLAFCVAALTARHAVAADTAPAGRWVASNKAGRTILCLFADASFQLTAHYEGQAATSSVGTYVVKDGVLTLSPKGGAPTEFTYVAGKGTLDLTLSADGVTKRLGFTRDMGPVVGQWRSDKLDTTWVLTGDGAMESTEGATVTKSTYEVVYVEPAAVEGNIFVHKEGSDTLSFHFTIEAKGARLVLGGGADAKDPTLRFPLDRVGAAPDMPAPATPPATPPADGPKRPKFPAPPKLPGGGGTTPAQPTAPVAPTPGTPPGATPAPAPDAPPPADGGLTWDTAAMTAKGFKILKTNYDADGAKITWVLEATRDITSYPTVRANFYDVDDIRIWDGSVSFSPSLVSKGEKVRAEMSLPYRDKMKNVVKIVLIPG